MKIYDCFTFFNELELLELRLKILSPYVDYFVLVESNVTHRGKSKPLYFDLNKEKFSAYKDKIIYIKLDTNTKETHPYDWSIENLQRNTILNGLKNCQDNDLVIISDLDEIPNPKILKKLKNNSLLTKNNVLKLHRIFRKRKNKLVAYSKYIQLLLKYNQNTSVLDILNITPLGFSQKHYYYYMNNLYTDKWWGSVISLYKNMKTPQSLRDIRRHLPVLNNGGWHFSYMGGYDRILTKANSTVDEDTSRNTNKEYSMEYIKERLSHGSRLYTHEATQDNVFSKVSIDDIGIDNLEDFAKKYPYMFF